MEIHEKPCGRCGSTNWADATPEQETAEIARLRRLSGDPDFEVPRGLEICQSCGAARSILTQTFRVPGAR
jgi:hypothetical protein